jgi:TonB family protein
MPIRDNGRTTLLGIPMVEERYGRAFLASTGIHIVALLLVVFGGYLLPRTVVRLGTGPGGGRSGGDSYSVGVVDDLSGGVGMVKPSLVPQPPALLAEKPAVEKSKAIPLPQTVEKKKTKPTEIEKKQAAKANPESNVIPTAPEPGSGGSGGRSGGSGGGFGGGNGISIGSGSGGFGDSWYARTVEARISSNWIRPPEGVRVEMTYSFYIASDGSVNGIRQEKSSGNPQLDQNAYRAIRALQNPPLPPPPPEFRGRLIQFIAQFVYPPNQ